MPLNIEIATANTLDPNNCHYPSKGGLSKPHGGLFWAATHLPENTGARLAINAVTASLWSWVKAQRIRRSASIFSEVRRLQPVAALIFSFM